MIVLALRKLVFVVLVGTSVTTHVDAHKCRPREVYNEDLGACLETCGKNVTCKTDEYCDRERGACVEVCYGGCPYCSFCDVITSKCEPCKDICRPHLIHIHEYPDCQMYCNDELRKIKAHESACWIPEKATTVTPLVTDTQLDIMIIMVVLISVVAVVGVMCVTLILRMLINAKGNDQVPLLGTVSKSSTAILADSKSVLSDEMEEQLPATARNAPSPTANHCEAQANHSSSQEDIESNKYDSISEQHSSIHHPSAAASDSVSSQLPGSTHSLIEDHLQPSNDDGNTASENCSIKLVSEIVADHQTHSSITGISFVGNHDSSCVAKISNVSCREELKFVDAQNDSYSSVFESPNYLSLHSDKSYQKSLPGTGLDAEEAPQEEKLNFPQQEKNISAVMRQIAEQQDLDLREDGNLPDNDAASGFDEEHPSNQGAAAARPAPGPPQAVPNARVIQLPANVGFDLNAVLNQYQNAPVVHSIANMDDIPRIPLNRRHQAEVDERARIAQIISGFHFVVYNIFTPLGVNVCVRPTDITLGEAKRVLVNAGVPEEILELELFRYQDESDDP